MTQDSEQEETYHRAFLSPPKTSTLEEVKLINEQGIQILAGKKEKEGRHKSLIGVSGSEREERWENVSLIAVVDDSAGLTVIKDGELIEQKSDELEENIEVKEHNFKSK